MAFSFWSSFCCFANGVHPDGMCGCVCGTKFEGRFLSTFRGVALSANFLKLVKKSLIIQPPSPFWYSQRRNGEILRRSCEGDIRQFSCKQAKLDTIALARVLRFSHFVTSGEPSFYQKSLRAKCTFFGYTIKCMIHNIHFFVFTLSTPFFIVWTAKVFLQLVE